MPFEAFEDHGVLLNKDTPAEYNPTGLTLASVRSAITDGIEAIRECVACGTVPSEQLFLDLENGQCDLYKFYERIDDMLEVHMELAPFPVLRHPLEPKRAVDPTPHFLLPELSDDPAEWPPILYFDKGRSAMTEQMQALRECIMDGKILSEKLFMDLVEAHHYVYRCVSQYELVLEDHFAHQPLAVTQYLLELRIEEGKLANLTDEMQDQLRVNVRAIFDELVENSRQAGEA